MRTTLNVIFLIFLNSTIFPIKVTFASVGNSGCQMAIMDLVQRELFPQMEINSNKVEMKVGMIDRSSFDQAVQLSLKNPTQWIELGKIKEKNGGEIRVEYRAGAGSLRLMVPSYFPLNGSLAGQSFARMQNLLIPNHPSESFGIGIHSVVDAKVITLQFPLATKFRGSILTLQLKKQIVDYLEKILGDRWVRENSSIISASIPMNNLLEEKVSDDDLLGVAELPLPLREPSIISEEKIIDIVAALYIDTENLMRNIYDDALNFLVPQFIKNIIEPSRFQLNGHESWIALMSFGLNRSFAQIKEMQQVFVKDDVYGKEYSSLEHKVTEGFLDHVASLKLLVGDFLAEILKNSNSEYQIANFQKIPLRDLLKNFFWFVSQISLNSNAQKQYLEILTSRYTRTRNYDNKILNEYSFSMKELFSDLDWSLAHHFDTQKMSGFFREIIGGDQEYNFIRANINAIILFDLIKDFEGHFDPAILQSLQDAIDNFDTFTVLERDFLNLQMSFPSSGREIFTPFIDNMKQYMNIYLDTTNEKQRRHAILTIKEIIQKSYEKNNRHFRQIIKLNLKNKKKQPLEIKINLEAIEKMALLWQRFSKIALALKTPPPALHLKR